MAVVTMLSVLNQLSVQRQPPSGLNAEVGGGRCVPLVSDWLEIVVVVKGEGGT
jgi:hypothetical protein